MPRSLQPRSPSPGPGGAPSSTGLTSHSWPPRGATGIIKGNGGTGKENPGWMECGNRVLVGSGKMGRSTKKRQIRVHACPEHPHLFLRPG